MELDVEHPRPPQSIALVSTPWELPTSHPLLL